MTVTKIKKSAHEFFDVYFHGQTKNIVLFIIMIAVLILFSSLRPDRFPTDRNFRSMMAQFPEFGILTLSMMLAMVIGGIDLSVVAVANLTGVLAARVLTAEQTVALFPGMSLIVVAIAVVFVVALLCGLINGILIAAAGVPPILATLGTQGMFMGIAIAVTGGHSISGLPPPMLFIGNGFIAGLPMPFLIFIATTLVAVFILKYTRHGFNMFMAGANPVVSRYSGVNNTQVIIRTYMLTAIFAGVSALIMMSRANSMRPGFGVDFLLLAILVAVLGGTDPRGGIASVRGVVMGILILQFTQTGLTMMAVSAFTRRIIWGLLLLLVMVVNFMIVKYQEEKRIRDMRNGEPPKTPIEFLAVPKRKHHTAE